MFLNLLLNAIDAMPDGGTLVVRSRRAARSAGEVVVLEAHRGDVSAAAVEAEVPRGTYYRLMKKHGLVAADFRQPAGGDQPS